MISIGINITILADSLLKGPLGDLLVQIETETSGFFVTTEDGFFIGVD